MSKELNYIMDDVFLLDKRLALDYREYRKEHPKDSELSMYMHAFIEGTKYVQHYVELIVSDCTVRDEQIFEKDNGKE